MFILILANSLVFAQNQFKDDLSLRINYKLGYNLPKYQVLRYLTNSHISGIEVGLFKQSNGSKEIHRLFNYPQYGIKLFYIDLGNKELLGKELGLTYNFGMDFISKTKFKLNGQLALGLSYVSKKYGSQNLFAVSVGSKVNAHFGMQLTTVFSPFERMEIRTGIGFNHFSNGNVKQPNLGINNCSYIIGVGYQITKPSDPVITEKKQHKAKTYSSVILSVGNKQPGSIFADNVITQGISLEVKRSISKIVRLGLGVDYSYDPSIKKEFSKRGQETKNSVNAQTGLHVSEVIIHHRFSVELQQGFYIGKTHELLKSQRYSKTILRYQVDRYFSVRFALKSHNLVADYPEIGLGITL